MKKNNKKLTVTVGLAVFNEENNIRNLIESLFLQVKKNYILKKIIVISDGSIDNTVAEIKKIKNHKVAVFAGKSRKGKTARLNEIFSIANTDLIVIMDGDIMPCNKDTIENLVRPFVNNNQIGLTSGKFIPHAPKTFIESCIANSRIPYAKARLEINHGNNLFSCGGKLMAISKKLYKRTTIPQNITADDGFLYFSCKSQKLKFKYVERASIWFKVPSTLRDHIDQNIRYMSQGNQIKSLFPILSLNELEIPKQILLPYLLKQLYVAPIESISIFLINFYIKFLKKFNKVTNSTGIWKISETTKEKIVHFV